MSAISYVCRTCHSTQANQLCARCLNAYYCNNTDCQEIDKKAHQVFCKMAPSVELAVYQREVDLKFIREISDDLLFISLIQRIFYERHGFMKITKDYMHFIPISRLAKMGDLSKQPKVVQEIKHEVEKTTNKPAVVILIYIRMKYRVHVIGKSDGADLMKVLQAMPYELVTQIYRTYVEDECLNMSRKQCLKLGMQLKKMEMKSCNQKINELKLKQAAQSEPTLPPVLAPSAPGFLQRETETNKKALA